ncbi:MAG: hypothetical protein QG602_3470 [Verrucomicrobiota bacterium]|nr:hypothetical protein [Verrucomicrobiota bacterium]
MFREVVNEVTGSSTQLSFYVPFVLFSYLVGHLLSLTSAFTVERFAIWCHGYPSKYLLRLNLPHRYWANAEGYPLRVAYRIMVPILLTPVAVFEFVIGKFLRGRELYAKPLDDALRPLIANRIGELLVQRCHALDAGEIEAKIAEHEKRVPTELRAHKDDFFNIVAQFIVAQRPDHLRTALNYVALYGFMRTTCLIAVVWFWIPILQVVVVDWFKSSRIQFCEIPEKLPWLYLSGVSIIAFLLFVGFTKFYRRYSQTVLLGILTLDCESRKK